MWQEVQHAISGAAGRVDPDGNVHSWDVSHPGWVVVGPFDPAVWVPVDNSDSVVVSVIGG